MSLNLRNKPTKKNKRIKYRKTNKRGGVGSAEKKKLRAERLAVSKQKIADSLAKLKNSISLQMDSGTAHDVANVSVQHKATSPIHILSSPPKAVPIEVYPHYETLAKEMKEIMTADELKKFLSYDNWLRMNEHYLTRQMFEAEMTTFRQMSPGEKVVWELVTEHYNGYNILLTNKGKILCLVNQTAYDMTPSQTANHDFWIPPECIDTIKILFKNMKGIMYTSQSGGGMYPTSRTHKDNFQAIYDNLNEWLEHVKSTL